MQNFDQISVEKPEQPYKFEDENYKQNENQPEIVKLSKLETIDDALEKIGHEGKFQKQSLFLVLLAWFFMTYAFLLPPLLFETPKFLCLNSNQEWEECTEDTGACDETSKIDPESVNSISLEFKLYCGPERELRDFGEAIVLLGVVIGLLIFNLLADNKGRRIALILSWLVGVLGTSIIIVSWNVYFILFGFLVMGIGIGSNGTVAQVYLNEISFGKFRQRSLIMTYMIWGIAETTILPISFITTDWRNLAWACFFIPQIILIIYPFLILESPKYYAQFDLKKTVEVLEKISEVNQTNIKFSEEDLPQINENQEKFLSYWTLFKYKSIRYMTIWTMLLFICPHVLYYGFAYASVEIGLGFAWNSFFFGIAETLSYTLEAAICHKIQRKKGTLIALFISSLLCLPFLFVSIPEDCEKGNCWQKDYQTIFATLARFVVSFAFGFCVLWANELFPTSVRSLGMGMVFSVGLMGGFLSPAIIDGSRQLSINPMLTIMIIGLIGMGFVLKLKETKGLKLEDQIKEQQGKD